MTEPVWSERNRFLKDYQIDNLNVLDFGCGDKSICNYFDFKSYVGFDREATSDIQLNFNDVTFEIHETGDLGLVLGVLEYLDDPNNFLNRIKHSCNRFIIMVLAIKGPKVHHGWQRVYNKESFNTILSKHFSNYNIKEFNKYLVADCYK